MKKYSVGRTDCKPLTKKQSGLGRSVKQRKFTTLTDAENFIHEHLSRVAPSKVILGFFYLDKPEYEF